MLLSFSTKEKIKNVKIIQVIYSTQYIFVQSLFLNHLVSYDGVDSYSSLLLPAHSIPVRCEGPDKADPDGADGHGTDEGT